jgi:xanthine dehydrogenase YagS FAD-binding subunit
MTVAEIHRLLRERLGPSVSDELKPGDWPLCDVAITVRTGAGRPVEAARVVLGSVAPVPWRAKAAEAALLQLGKVDAAGVRAVGQAAVQGATPLSKNSYKVSLCQGLVARAAFELLGGK